MEDDALLRKGDRLFRNDTGRLSTIIDQDFFSRRSQVIQEYRRAAAELGVLALSEKEHNDSLAFPIVFLYRHAYENLLKAILESGYAVTEVKPEYKKHELVALWDECTKVLTVLDLGQTGIEKHARILFLELEKLDRPSFVFRYHSDTNGRVTRGIPTHFDLVNFVEVADRLADYLTWAVGEVEERVSHILEQRADW